MNWDEILITAGIGAVKTGRIGLWTKAKKVKGDLPVVVMRISTGPVMTGRKVRRSVR